MTATEKLQSLLGEIGREIGEELRLDADGECQVETDLGDEIVITAVDEAGMVVVSLPIAPVPADDAAAGALLREAMTINDDLALTGGTCLCLAPGHDMMVLRGAVEASALDAAALWQRMTLMVPLADEMREHLVRGERLADDAGPDDAERDQVAGLIKV